MSFFPRKASFTLAAWLLVSAIASAVEASDDAKVLMSIASVETGGNRLAVGDNKRARGQYQTHKTAWEDGNEQLMREGLKTYPWAGWKSALAQDMIASALLRSIRYKLKQRGINNPSVRQLALVWGCGFERASEYGFNPDKAPPAKADYCQRVENIFSTY